MLFSPKCIATIRLTFSCEIIRSHSKTHKTNNDIISLYRNRITFQTNTVSGGCLTGNCQVTIYYFQRAVQIYQSTHCKHNRTRSALADTVTQSPFFVGVCQWSHHIHLSTCSACSKPTGAICTWKCSNRRTVRSRILFQCIIRIRIIISIPIIISFWRNFRSARNRIIIRTCHYWSRKDETQQTKINKFQYSHK